MSSEKPVSWKQGWTITGYFWVLYCIALGSASLLRSPSPQAELLGTGLRLPPLRQVLRDVGDWLASWAPLSDMPKEQRLQLLIEENAWKNGLVMWMFPDSWVEAMPHFTQTWVRCIVLCAAVYFVVGGLWCYYCYFCFGDKLFKPGTIPAFPDVFEQVKISFWAIPLYSLLPTLTEWAAEMGWTMAYPRVDNVGLPMYALYFVLYMASVEFGVYWMHRGLHDVRVGYNVLHHIHHKYNKEHTLSPFAGLAFHPLDGILQAIPYTWTMFFCPMHFLTHEILLFFTGVWTTNIHDCIHGKIWPIMGAGYHTIHHTTYKHNYGHYFIFMDHLFGTLLTPEEHEEEQAQAAAARSSPSASSDIREEAGSEADDAAPRASSMTTGHSITTRSRSRAVAAQ